MPSGQIVSLTLEKGFGFIKPPGGGADVFFHGSIVNGPMVSLKVGQTVEFEVDPDAKKARAKSVTVPGGGVRRPVRQGGRKSAGKPRNPVPPRASGVKTERGFVTKLHWKKDQGFISADSGGAELLFDRSDVEGDKKFHQIKIGDYVRFVRIPSKGRNPLRIRRPRSRSR